MRHKCNFSLFFTHQNLKSATLFYSCQLDLLIDKISNATERLERTKSYIEIVDPFLTQLDNWKYSQRNEKNGGAEGRHPFFR